MMVVQFQQRKSGLIVPAAPPRRHSQAEIHREYDRLHCRCPQCGGDNFEVTCLGFVFVNLESAVDSNHVQCGCGWSGIVHDLVLA
jgi:hypothetical protein